MMLVASLSKHHAQQHLKSTSRPISVFATEMVGCSPYR
jgi:hypothetical protein